MFSKLVGVTLSTSMSSTPSVDKLSLLPEHEEDNGLQLWSVVAEKKNRFYNPNNKVHYIGKEPQDGSLSSFTIPNGS